MMHAERLVGPFRRQTAETRVPRVSRSVREGCCSARRRRGSVSARLGGEGRSVSAAALRDPISPEGHCCRAVSRADDPSLPGVPRRPAGAGQWPGPGGREGHQSGIRPHSVRVDVPGPLSGLFDVPSDTAGDCPDEWLFSRRAAAPAARADALEPPVVPPRRSATRFILVRGSQRGSVMNAGGFIWLVICVPAEIGHHFSHGCRRAVNGMFAR